MDLAFLILAIIFLPLPGILLSLLALIPPVYKQAQNKLIVRVITSLVIIVISFGIWFLGERWVYVTAMDVFIAIPATIPGPDGEYDSISEETLAKYKAHRSAVLDEAWTRSIIPPPLRRPCYTPEKVVCEVADQLPGGNWQTSRQYFKEFFIYMLAGIPGGGLAWYFSRVSK